MKKKINSKQKGNRTERELAKILTEHFSELFDEEIDFARVGASSGARVKNTKLPSHATVVMTSDLIVPKGFRFSVECKATKENIDLLQESALLEKWLQQATDDANSIGNMPMLCWKQYYKGWYCAMPGRAFANIGGYPANYVRYACGTPKWHWGWYVFRLDALLVANPKREFWFGKKEPMECFGGYVQ
jgi:Holliday junction resolvase